MESILNWRQHFATKEGFWIMIGAIFFCLLDDESFACSGTDFCAVHMFHTNKETSLALSFQCDKIILLFNYLKCSFSTRGKRSDPAHSSGWQNSRFGRQREREKNNQSDRTKSPSSEMKVLKRLDGTIQEFIEFEIIFLWFLSSAQLQGLEKELYSAALLCVRTAAQFLFWPTPAPAPSIPTSGWKMLF